MKLIKWENVEGIEAYTTCKYDESAIFNMSFNDSLSYDIILNNRKKLAEYLHSDLDHMVATNQQHTTNFLKVTKNDGGKGMYNKEDAFYAYDAMYTRDKNLWLWSFHADCCPVLLYCKKQKIIAAIHSGWKGTVGEIVSKVTTHLIEHENVEPSEIYAYLGPSISQKNYEVKDDIITYIKQMSFDTSSFYLPFKKDSYLLDNKGLIKQQLLNLGVKEENITVSSYCTVDNNDLFFSYRKEKTMYRNITLIKMK